MPNLAVIKQWIDINWSGKWLTEPSHVDYENHAGNLATERILYRDLGEYSHPVGLNAHKETRYHRWELQYETATKSNIDLLLAELEYLTRHAFYPAPFFPSYTADSSILCHLDCDEGTGSTVADSTGNYDFTYATPDWETTGNPWQANYLTISNPMSNATLLDTIPATGFSIIFVGRLSAAFHATELASSTQAVYKTNVTDEDKVILLLHGGSITTSNNLCGVYAEAANGGVFTSNGKELLESKWFNFTFTWGARGLEVFIDGRAIIQDTSKTTVMGNGTAANFTVGPKQHAGSHYWELTRLQVRSGQVLPYNEIRFENVQHAGISLDKHTYTIQLVGIQKEIFVGGNL